MIAGSPAWGLSLKPTPGSQPIRAETSQLGWVDKPTINKKSKPTYKTQVLMHLHGVAMDENDDKGRPPYPIVDNLSNQEVSNCKMYLPQIAKCICLKLQNIFVSNC